MSEILTSVEAVIMDLDCLKATLEQHFPMLKLVEGKKTYAWYGKVVGQHDDARSADKHGIPVEDWGKCDHVIQMEGVNYEVGLVKRKSGEGWSLVWDEWGKESCDARNDGHKLSACIGKGAEHIMTHYNTTYMHRFAEETGMEVEQSTNEDGTIEVVLTERGY